MYKYKYCTGINIDRNRSLYVRNIQCHAGRLNNQCDYRGDNAKHKYTGNLHGNLHFTCHKSMCTGNSNSNSNDNTVTNGKYFLSSCVILYKCYRNTGINIKWNGNIYRRHLFVFLWFKFKCDNRSNHTKYEYIRHIHSNLYHFSSRRMFSGIELYNSNDS